MREGAPRPGNQTTPEGTSKPAKTPELIVPDAVRPPPGFHEDAEELQLEREEEQGRQQGQLPEPESTQQPVSGELQHDQVLYRGPLRDPAELPTDEASRPPPEPEALQPEVEEAVQQYAMGNAEEEHRLREAAKADPLLQAFLKNPGRFTLARSTADLDADDPKPK